MIPQGLQVVSKMTPGCRRGIILSHCLLMQMKLWKKITTRKCILSLFTMQPSPLGLASWGCQGTCGKEELKVKLLNFHQRLRQNIFICVIIKFSVKNHFQLMLGSTLDMSKVFCRNKAHWINYWGRETLAFTSETALGIKNKPPKTKKKIGN